MDWKKRDKIYAVWDRGDRQLRLALTALGHRPVLQLGIGDESGGRWIPGTRGVCIELDEIEVLMASLRKASADIKKFSLIDKNPSPKRILPKHKRWARD